jgi:hypothetical protein
MTRSVLSVHDQGVLLARVTHRGTFRGGPYEIAFLTVSRVGDASGALRDYIMFSPDDEAQARECFTRIARARDAALTAPVLVAYRALIAAFNARDFEALEQLVDPAVHWADHRPGFREEIDSREGFMATSRNTALAGHLRWAAEVIDHTDRQAFARSTYSGSYRGGRFEVVMFDVNAVGDDGRFVSGELFAEDQETEARAAYARLSSAGTGPLPAS